MSSVVQARWFPAQISLPDGRHLRRVFVLVARGGEHSGVHVYTQPDRRVWHADINWARQPEIPKTQRAARNGVELMLAEGERALVTPSASCRCGALGRWAGPTFATTVSA